MKATAARHIWFSGQVQGVGFRWTAHKIANHYQLTGYVRNLDDGRVEMLAQGTPQDLEKCLNDIAETFGSYIRDVEATDTPVNTSYTSFNITY
jgi:acylphosphatase